MRRVAVRKSDKGSVHEFRNTEMSVSPQSDHNPISSHESHGKRSVHISKAATPPSLPEQLDKQNPGQPAAAANVEYTNGSFVNALFEGKYCVGQIIDIDDTKEYQPLLINFMTKTQCHKVAHFKRPSSKIKDLIWMNPNKIVLCIPPLNFCEEWYIHTVA